jgi:tetratricopeptide (TPR) repeat protein
MNTLDQAKQLDRQAGTERNNGHALEAIKLYEQAKKLYLAAGNKLDAAGMQHMIGVCYKIENDLEKCIPALEQAAKEYKEAGDLLGPGRVLRDIGIMYEYHERVNEAEKYLLQSQAELESQPEGEPNPGVDEQVSRNAELGITTAKLGLLYLGKKQLDKAKRYSEDGLALIRKAGHPFYELTALGQLAGCYFMTKEYGLAQTHVEAALGIIYEHNMQDTQQRRLAQLWGSLAHCYLAQDNRGSAKHFAKKSLDIINSLSPDAQKPLRKDILADELEKIV